MVNMQEDNDFSFFKFSILQIKRFQYFFGGISQKQIRSLCNRALKYRNDAILFFLKFLESRLDIAVFRLGFYTSIKEVKQDILHSKILVNDSVVSYYSFELKNFDIISFNSNLKKNLCSKNLNLNKSRKKFFKLRIKKKMGENNIKNFFFFFLRKKNSPFFFRLLKKKNNNFLKKINVKIVINFAFLKSFAFFLNLFSRKKVNMRGFKSMRYRFYKKNIPFIFSNSTLPIVRAVFKMRRKKKLLSTKKNKIPKYFLTNFRTFEFLFLKESINYENINYFYHLNIPFIFKCFI